MRPNTIYLKHIEELQHQCGMVEPHIINFVLVRFQDSSEPVKCGLKAWKQCKEQATIQFADNNKVPTIHEVCNTHAKDILGDLTKLSNP